MKNMCRHSSLGSKQGNVLLVSEMDLGSGRVNSSSLDEESAGSSPMVEIEE